MDLAKRRRVVLGYAQIAGGILAIAVPPLIFLGMGISSLSRIIAWSCCLLGILGLLILFGLDLNRRALGIFVDERNRYSLSRLQITLWTALVIGTIYTVCVSNLMIANGWKDALRLDMDMNLVLLMGFSLASFTVAPLALELSSSRTVEGAGGQGVARDLKQVQNLNNVPIVSGGILTKFSPKDARVGDLVRGEKSNDCTNVDLSRTQMLIITVVVVLTYGGAVLGCLQQSHAGRIGVLPSISNTLLMFILISHGGYLAGKLSPASTQGERSLANAGRALEASQRATMVATDLQTCLLTVLPGDARRKQMEDALAYAQGTASEAAALTAGIGAPGYESEKIAKVEGKVEALRAILQSQRAFGVARNVADAPSPELVRTVQRKLSERGYAISISGIPDAGTEQAIGVELRTMGLNRSDLHPAAYRYYEEFVELI